MIFSPCSPPLPVSTPRVDRGFSLIEITFALLVLAGSLVTLLGLQSSILERTGRDSMKQHAMLAAGMIMAAVETSALDIEVQDRSGSLAEILALLLPSPPAPTELPREFERLTARIQVENWQIEGLEADAIRRVLVTLSWSPAPPDSFTVLYFLPGSEGDEEIEEEEVE